MEIPNYHEELQKAIAESRQSGRVVRRIFNKTAFLQQFPQAALDPRMAMTKENFFLNVTPLEAISVAELKNLCLQASVKDSDLAKTKLLSLIGLGDNQVVRVYREELDCLKNGNTQTIVQTRSELIVGGLGQPPENVIPAKTRKEMRAQTVSEINEKVSAQSGGLGSTPKADAMKKEEDLIQKPKLEAEEK